MTTVAKFGAGELFTRSALFLRMGGARAAAAFLLIVALSPAVGFRFSGSDALLWLDFLLFLLTTAAEYLLIRAALASCRPGVAVQAAGFGAYAMLTIISQFTILVGLALLIVPGVILSVRWWMAGPLLLDSELTIFEALRGSWRRTEGHFWAMFTVIAPAYLLALLIMLAIDPGLDGIWSDGYTLPQALLLNLSLTAPLVYGWYVSVAAYSLTTG